jgi:glycogen phosphorylase
MKPIQQFVVNASIPESLAALRDIAYNLWWYWNVEAVQFFYRLDRDSWDTVYHNPVAMLGRIPQKQFDDLASDEGVRAALERVHTSFAGYMDQRSWFSRTHPDRDELTIAYFSLEFGLSECVPIYSGGLGILAGDHLKSASDLGIPIVAVGLLYQEGYFKQYLNTDGWQSEIYPDNDFYNMPVLPVTDAAGHELIVELELPDGILSAKVWKLQVGRVPLILLDTNIPQNSREFRSITRSLYSGGDEMRLKQEMLLGIGGLRALNAMDIMPSICHMNEGHAAFLALERILNLMGQEDMTYDEAFDLASAGNVFTTHTPVAAGHDRFSAELMLKYFKHYYPELGLTAEEFLGLGRIDPSSTSETFCMTVLALKCSDNSNAVSLLHRKVSRRMWQGLWPEFPVEEVPIAHVTNGVHLSSWVSQGMVELFDRYLGLRWRNEPASDEIFIRVRDIPDEEVWRTHERRRERLVTFARRRLQTQLTKRGVSDVEVQLASGALDSEVLTIGFARRFASYKRADLIFSDVDRLVRILNNPERPVQFIIAGKAHPHDNEGKRIISRIIHFCRRPDLRNRVVFIEDYDICVARYMVQGVDIWLNTPRRPLEASGTSGMKAAANGALNLSILDGWWDEAYTPDVGWAIGSGEMYDNPDLQDRVESNAIYDILEKDIVPLYYDRGSDRIPRKWTEKMKTALARLLPVYNTDRMVHQYFVEHYLPAAERYRTLKDDGARRARDLALWKRRILEHWDEVSVTSVDADGAGPFTVGDSATVRAVIKLGKLTSEDVAVQLYAGNVNAGDELVDAVPILMQPTGTPKGGTIFEGLLPFEASGRFGFSVRVLPAHPDLASHQDLMLVKWAGT